MSLRSQSCSVDIVLKSLSWLYLLYSHVIALKTGELVCAQQQWSRVVGWLDLVDMGGGVTAGLHAA